jgi:uncharacterized protein (UPF0332 family)
MINPVDFLTFANNLLTENGEEILLRNSISRTYYYAFHHVRENLGDKFTDYKRNQRKNSEEKLSDHKLIFKFLMENRRMDLGNIMRNMYKRRNDADYELKKDFEKNDAEEFIKDAKAFISGFDASGLA